MTCKKNKNRVNVYADNSFVFACDKETAVLNGLKKGLTLDDETINNIKEEDINRLAFSKALSYVARKMRSFKEVEDKLKQLGFKSHDISSAINKLCEYGYIDDEIYAKTYAQELAQRYGQKVVQYKLIQKGIEKDIAKKYSYEYTSADVLKEHLSRLDKKYSSEEPYKRKQKTIRSLLAKGFSYDEIKSVLGEVEEEYEE